MDRFLERTDITSTTAIGKKNVNDPGHYDYQRTPELQQDESCCAFVVSGEREWENRNEANTITIAIKNNTLTMMDNPPKNKRKEKAKIITILKNGLKNETRKITIRLFI